MMDFNKIDVVKPTPKQLCTKMHEECTYCKYDEPHPSTTPSDWSSEDWDGKKAKARQQCPLLDFNLLERQLQKTLQDTMQDIPQDILNDSSVEMDLMKDLHYLTLKEDIDMQNLMDAPAPLLEAPEKKSKTEDADDDTSNPQYEMTRQEHQLQEEEGKYEIYMSDFGYEGDDSDLDSETDTESNVTAYPYLD